MQNKISLQEKEKIISKEWFDEAYFLCYERFCVLSTNKYNIICEDGHFLLKKWVDDIHIINHVLPNLFKIINNKKYNFIDRDGNFLLDKDADFASDFDCYNNEICISQVHNNNKYNFINLDGDLLLDDWIPHNDYKNPNLDEFDIWEKYHTDDGWDYTNSHSESMFSKKVRYCTNFSDEGLALFQDFDGKYGIVDANKNIYYFNKNL